MIDAVRVVSLLVVVLGHWLIADVRVVDGAVVASNVLDEFPALHLATWLFQVMPLFFVAGGFADGLVWTRHRDGDRGCSRYLRARMDRLLFPVLVFVLLAQGSLGSASLLGLPTEMAGAVARAWGQPLWFLAVYVFVTALAPMTYRWHERAPVSALVVLAGAAVAADVTRLTTDVGTVPYANFLLVWLFAHQLGYWYADGRLDRTARPVLAATAVTAVAMLAALTFVGPYPVSMVGVAGEMSNMSPPSICLLLLGVAQTALLTLARPRLTIFLQRPRLWAGVVSTGAMAMTLYLWHLVALVAVVGVGALLHLSGAPGGSTTWWATRPLWLATLAVVLLLLAVPVSRLERWPGRRLRANSGETAVPPPAVALLGSLLGALGLAGLAIAGLEPFGAVRGSFIGVPTDLPVSSLLLLVGWVLIAGYRDPRLPDRERRRWRRAAASSGT